MNDTAIIKVSDLIRTFGDLTAVNGVSFEVSPGEVFAFLGPNGAGKSTTIKMLTTLLHPTSGSIRIDGFDPVTQPDQVRHAVGIVFQDPSLDEDLTAFENMDLHGRLYGVQPSTRKARIDELLSFVGLSERRNSYVKEFSGGMKRRLEIARGLLHHPKVLFLDEPTLGLDPQTRNSMWEHLHNLQKTEGMTVFFTTHYMEEADRNAGRIAVIDHGKIIASGSSAELKQQTNAQSLEDAFLSLTGKAIREESAEASLRMRMRARR